MRSSLLMFLLLFSIVLCRAADWPQWRGLHRDGISAEVPATLPAKTLIWKMPLRGETHAGIVISGNAVIVLDHGDGKDYTRCFAADTGKAIWTYFTVNRDTQMQYGACPRATPLIAGDSVYVLSAHGDLSCLTLKDGKPRWTVNLPAAYTATMPEWGYCASPLLADGKLIVNPGGKAAALVALDPVTGKAIWTTPGNGAGYAGFITGTFGGVAQVVGYDAESLGGWEIATGKRLWTMTPENPGDYNVGTPVSVNGKLLIATENNGTRLYAFATAGKINPIPMAANDDLRPDMASPIVANGMVFGSAYALFCLDAVTLKLRWTHDTDAQLNAFSSMITGNNRVLIFTESGMLYLLAPDAKKCTILGKQQLCGKSWAHPALANGWLLVRDAKWLYCYRLAPPQ